MREGIQFCAACGKEMPYYMRNVTICRPIRGKEHIFEMAAAFCDGCGEAVSPPGLFDGNAAWIDRQYREKERIAGAEMISELTALYRIDGISLLYALGFEETEAAGYLAGQMPSAEDSDVIRKALESPDFMMEKLRKNRERIGGPAFGTAMCAGRERRHFLALSEKMRQVIYYLLKKTAGVTPLTLQKMLYFTQGLHMALHGRELFSEDCQAWAHGPVYKEVYGLFRDFHSQPIQEPGFFSYFMPGKGNGGLSGGEKKVIDQVAEALRIYDGKTLEKVTHEEAPWKEARAGCLPGQRSGAVIAKESVRVYFVTAASRYDFTSFEGIRNYIESRLSVDGEDML